MLPFPPVLTSPDGKKKKSKNNPSTSGKSPLPLASRPLRQGGARPRAGPACSAVLYSDSPSFLRRRGRDVGPKARALPCAACGGGLSPHQKPAMPPQGGSCLARALTGEGCVLLRRTRLAVQLLLQLRWGAAMNPKRSDGVAFHASRLPCPFLLRLLNSFRRAGGPAPPDMHARRPSAGLSCCRN